MQRILYLLSYAVLVTVIAGCGEAPETEAANEIHVQVDVARRHFVRAAGLLSVSPAVQTGSDTEPIAPTWQVNPEALAALAEAEKTLTAAITAGAAATDAGKAPANSLLAEVRLAMAAYHGMVARERGAVTADLLRQIESGAARAQVLAALDRAMEDLTASTTAPDDQASALAVAGAFLDGIRARQADASATVDRLAADDTALTRQIEQVAAETEVKRQSASDLRRQNRTAMGLAKLELDEKASTVEAQVEAGEAHVGTLQLRADEVAADLELAKAELAAIDRQRTALNDFVDGLRRREADVKEFRAELTAMRTQTADQSADLYTALTARFGEAVAEFDRGLSACERAAKANDHVLRTRKALGGEARQMKSDNPGSAMAPLLDAMSHASQESGPTVRKGRIAYAAGELARQKLELQRRVERVAGHVAVICETAGIAEPAALKKAASSVADLTALADRADGYYDESVVAFIRVADRLLAGSPLNTRGTKWMYQQAQARALLGRHRLMALLGRPKEARDYLNQAGQLARQLLEGHEGDPAYLPVRQIVEDVAKIEAQG